MWITPQQYTKGELVLLYDQAKEPLGEGKFKPMWHGPYIMRHVLEKGTYQLEYYVYQFQGRHPHTQIID